MTEHIPTEAVMQRALALVRGAKSRLRATELLRSPLRPLPADYLQVLEEKLQEGLDMQRIVFGSEKECQDFQRSVPLQHPHYYLRRSDPPLYQRCLIVDDQRMLFAIEKEGLRLFFYTDEISVVKSFVDYFEKIFQAADVISI